MIFPNMAHFLLTKVMTAHYAETNASHMDCNHIFQKNLVENPGIPQDVLLKLHLGVWIGFEEFLCDTIFVSYTLSLFIILRLHVLFPEHNIMQSVRK